MKPWTVDAREAIADLSQVDYDSIELNEGLRNFLTEGGRYFVIGTKGFGKSLLLLARRKQLGNIHMIPEHTLLDVPSVKILGQISKEATARLQDDETMVFIWSLSIIITIVKRLNLSEDIIDATSDSLKKILNSKLVVTIADVFATVLLDIGRRDFYEHLSNDYNRILLPKFRTIKQQVAAFIDNIDECFENNMLLWYSAQNALIRAIYDLVRVNNKMKIYASIRKEAFLRNTSEMFLQYRGVSVTLEYSRSELKDIFRKNIASLPTASLFYSPEETDDLIGAFVGAAIIPHGFVQEGERVCDYIFRHTLRRPRDLMEIGGAIYSCDKSDRNPNTKAGLDRFKAIVNDSAANIARSYLGEVLPHLSITRADIDKISMLIDCNVIARQKLKRICAEFNGNAKCKMPNCKQCHNKHVFCELYKIGLLGYVKPRDTRDGEEQKFLAVGDKLFDDTGLLPMSSYYLIHPAFAEYIRQKNTRFRSSRDFGNILGYDRAWYSKKWPRIASGKPVSCSVNDTEREVERTALEILQQHQVFELDRYTVVGGYRRYNEEDRAKLLSLSQQITAELNRVLRTRRNYLIWATPGSGKSYFIEELVNIAGIKQSYVAIDISKDTEKEVRLKLARIDGNARCLCMIDEIDGRANTEWPYDVIYKKLDINESKDSHFTTVFVLIGSSGNDVYALKEAIKSRYKGEDLISRVPENSQYYIQIPPLGVGDSLCIYISKVLDASRQQRKRITYVKKMAAFHAMLTTSNQPRQIKMLADQAVSRVEKNVAILNYDHHFDRGVRDNKAFWNRHVEAAELLGESMLPLI